MEIERRSIKINLQIAPLIDVIFNLLLFFMLTYQITRDPGIKITFPQSLTARLQDEEKIIVFINKKNEIFLNEKKTGINELKSALKERLKISQKKTVILKADEKVNLGLAVKVMDIAKQVNAEGIVISTKVEEDVKR